MTVPKNDQDDVEKPPQVSSEDLDNFFQRVLGKSLLEFAKDIEKLNDENLEKINLSLDQDYVAVYDFEDYPPEAIRAFEGRAMVSTRLVLEKVKQRRNQNKPKE
jgi:hypothetical protein